MTNESSPATSLQEVQLRFQLGGRLRNISKLKHWQMAIAEAVKNAMDAVAESGRKAAISVEIQRASDLASNNDGQRPVTCVIVRDNGSGFNDNNFLSFCTPDSLHKHQQGGKGLGRLTCLQAFRQIQVRSVFENGGGWSERKLVLQGEHPELSAVLNTATSTVPLTEVRLTDLRPEFNASACMDFDDIAEWLSEHFLPALVEGPKWLGSLTLKDGKHQLDLTRVIEGGAQWVEKFKVGGYEFRAVCYSLTEGDAKDMVRLVAGGRVVHANTRPLEFYLPHLQNISDNSPHVVLIYSPFFDEHVNDARNGVSFAEEGDGVLLGITAPRFRDACAEAFKKNLSGHLQRSVDEFKERISQVVSRETPYYRPLLLGFFSSKEFNSLSRSSRDEEILSTLDIYKRRDAIKLKQESKRLAKLKSEGDEFWESAKKLADQIEVQRKVALAEYVALRKIVLDRLEQLIEARDMAKAARESAIHNLVFPQRTDTESNPGIDHQLWIVDERFESHNYLASDQPIDGKHGDRPDLLIALDCPGAFACEPVSKARGYDRMVLVEFKRALTPLENVPTDDLPHEQMKRYARQIIDEKAIHLGSKRPIKVTTDVRFYMYAVCELSEKLLARLKESGFTPSPTGDGAFGVTNEGRYYFEYISLPKLLEDAQARNLAFFRRLGLDG